MKKATYILISLILSINLCIAQGGFKRSIKLLGSFNNTTKTAFETTGGNYIIGGICVDTLNGFTTNRLTLIGLNNLGQKQWVKKYGNYKFEYLDNPIITKWFYKQGNFIYHAGCVRDSNNIYLGVLIKFNFNGDTLWQKRFYEAGYDVIPQQVVGSVDGGFLITGWFQNTTTSPALIIKTDANGNELWRKKIHKGIPDTQDAKVILQDSATKKIVTFGYQYIGNSQNWYTAQNILILDSLGNKLQQLHYSNTECNSVNIIQTKDKNFIAIGNEYNGILAGSVPSYKSYAVKFDINNPTVPIWSLRFDKLASGNCFYDIQELPNEDLLISGNLDTAQENNLNINSTNRLTRITKNGVIVWSKYYNYQINTSIDNAQRMISLNRTSDKGFISAIEQSYINPNKFFVVKYDSTGCDSSAYYCQTVGVKELEIINDKLKIYPNPANEVINVEFLESNNETYKIEITNTLGEVLLSQIATTNNLTLNINNFNSGIYFIQLYNKTELIATKKVIKH